MARPRLRLRQQPRILVKTTQMLGTKALRPDPAPGHPSIPLYLRLREIPILGVKTAPNRLGLPRGRSRTPQRLPMCSLPLALPDRSFRNAQPMSSKGSLRNSAARARYASPLSVRAERSEPVEPARGSRPALNAEQAARVAGCSVLPGTPARSAYAQFVTTRIQNVALLS